MTTDIAEKSVTRHLKVTCAHCVNPRKAALVDGSVDELLAFTTWLFVPLEGAILKFLHIPGAKTAPGREGIQLHEDH